MSRLLSFGLTDLHNSNYKSHDFLHLIKLTWMVVCKTKRLHVYYAGSCRPKKEDSHYVLTTTVLVGVRGTNYARSSAVMGLRLLLGWFSAVKGI